MSYTIHDYLDDNFESPEWDDAEYFETEQNDPSEFDDFEGSGLTNQEFIDYWNL